MKPPQFIDYLESPVGLLEIGASDQGVSSVSFVEEKRNSEMRSKLTDDTTSQLKEYFSGTRRSFSLKFDFSGTDFQKKVWYQLLEIPFGKTISYLRLAMHLGDPKSIRAAGSANGKNPVAIIIPCHRVIGSDGSLIGYGGGLWRKKWLLEFEGGMKQAMLL